MKTQPIGGAALRRPLALVAALLVAAASGNALLAGCGGGNKSEQTAQNQSTTTTPPAMPTDTSGTAGGTGAIDAGAIFKLRCATCHGPTGHGDGPGAVALNPKPRNYHDKAYMSTRTDEQLYNSIYNGKSQMPAWGKLGTLTPDQIRAMVAYVRKLSEQP